MKTSLPTKDTPHEVTLAQRTLAVQALLARGAIDHDDRDLRIKNLMDAFVDDHYTDEIEVSSDKWYEEMFIRFLSGVAQALGWVVVLGGIYLLFTT